MVIRENIEHNSLLKTELGEFSLAPDPSEIELEV